MELKNPVPLRARRFARPAGRKRSLAGASSRSQPS
jgi:hypothetical protein